MNTNLTAAKAAKKDYINNIIQACDDVLEYKEVVNDLGRRVEAAYYDVDDLCIGSIYDILYHCSEPLFRAKKRFDELESLLNGPEKYTDITLQMHEGWEQFYYAICDGSDDYIKELSSEDVSAIKSIMGQVELLRDTLIWLNT